MVTNNSGLNLIGDSLNPIRTTLNSESFRSKPCKLYRISKPICHSAATSQKYPINKYNIKRIKGLLLVFLKQFDIDEFRFLIKYLKNLLDRYHTNPIEIFSNYFKNYSLIFI